MMGLRTTVGAAGSQEGISACSARRGQAGPCVGMCVQDLLRRQFQTKAPATAHIVVEEDLGAVVVGHHPQLDVDVEGLPDALHPNMLVVGILDSPLHQLHGMRPLHEGGGCEV